MKAFREFVMDLGVATLLFGLLFGVTAIISASWTHGEVLGDDAFLVVWGILSALVLTPTGNRRWLIAFSLLIIVTAIDALMSGQPRKPGLPRR